jgi:hypothetical protein
MRSDWMTEDGSASISRTDFLKLATKAAHAKAHELGWLVMSNAVEYLFAATIALAGRPLRQGVGRSLIPSCLIQ